LKEKQIQITPKIVQDTYSGITKSSSHKDAEQSLNKNKIKENKNMNDNQIKKEIINPIYDTKGEINQLDEKVEEGTKND
jgi:hypothetical protein